MPEVRIENDREIIAPRRAQNDVFEREVRIKIDLAREASDDERRNLVIRTHVSQLREIPVDRFWCLTFVILKHQDDTVK